MALEMSKPASEGKNHCCISHEFVRAASKAPAKVAVIHALGGARIAGERQSMAVDSQIEGRNNDAGGFLRETVYEGDQCFTFSDLLASVDSLSCRLRRILDGGDDPHLLRPSGDLHSDKSLEVPVSTLSKPSSSRLEQSIDLQNMIMPKIVGLYMVPSIEYIVGVLSVLRCGEAFLPLDPSWPEEKITSAVSSSKADLILSCRSFFEGSCSLQHDQSQLLANCTKCPVLWLSMEECLAECYDSSNLIWPCENSKRRLFCYLMYTSGSTGKPKGVCGTEDGLLNRFLWMQESYPLLGEEFLLFKTAISFIDHLQEFISAVLATCTLVIPPLSKLKENLFYVVDFLQVYAIDRLISVPSLMRAVLPVLRSPVYVHIQTSLKLLVLSGEVLSLSLWHNLSNLLPKTSILNLYGSTEVSGDCTYFDCKRLPTILETESLSSVPIGRSISNCYVLLSGENDTTDQGELCVGGSCVSIGYLSDNTIMPLEYVSLFKDPLCESSEKGKGLYFKTGDFAKQLRTGDFVFMGRNDRIIKVNAQRIALEEIENTFRRHPDIEDAAVTFCKCQEDFAVLVAFIISKLKNKCCKNFNSSIRSWMINKLPLPMIPSHFFYMESFPMSSTGKVDYVALEDSSFSMLRVQDVVHHFHDSDLLEVIKKAFCNALMVEKLSDDDDFFMIGGNSISAAHTSHNLGIDMRLLYNFPTPSKLQNALLEKRQFNVHGLDAKWDMNVNGNKVSLHNSFNFGAHDLNTSKSGGSLLGASPEKTDDLFISKRLKTDSDLSGTWKGISQNDMYLWSSNPLLMSCSFTRCNKVMCEGDSEINDVYQATWSADFPTNVEVHLRGLWKVHLGSCVDASPTIVFKNGDPFLFIGSHSHSFVCINAQSGSVQWEVELEGRIECSTSVVSDFSQVVAGCYEGKIYFIDFSNGKICWSFQTFGEVKSQPVVDVSRHLVWCGSYDHNLYALDYRDYCCAYKLACGGSIYGSPAIDEVCDTLYVASTSGRVTALSIKDLKFNILWLHELEVPVFGSLSISPLDGNVICCLVDGHVVALDASGCVSWKVKTGGPIFAGSCISHALVSQVLICSRNGSIYSFGLETGSLLWEYNVGDPITASAYVDENLNLLSSPSHPSDRLVCICTSSGNVHLLRINMNAISNFNQSRTDVVRELARLNLQGDIFSSPVMIAGRIFVGCRDDYVHCIGVEGLI